jgi:hypothetical protein
MMKFTFTCLTLLVLSSMLYSQTDAKITKGHEGIHKVVVRAVLQTNNYTYLGVRENEDTTWLAVPKMEANPGEIYYYQGGNEMVDFKSSSLNRTFKSVWFLAGVVSENDMLKTTSSPTSSKSASGSKAEESKLDLKIEPVEGGISIGELFANPEKYSGQTVKVKGQVIKFSSSIMGKNWIHLQDGTEFEGQFDFVATTDQIVKQGDVIVAEGKISLNKDFGYGYFYKVIMEESKIQINIEVVQPSR